jgi:acyl-homoserine lactone acylase PvdQ
MSVVAEMSRPMRVSAAIPSGQSEHPGDPHYDDQIAPWLSGEQHTLATGFDDPTGATLVLEPQTEDAR